MKALELQGQRFGKLTVIGYAGKQGRDRLWRCKCDCGSIVMKRRGNLRSGRTQSCGCARDGSYARTHGMSKTRTYRIWKHIKERCTSPSCKEYRYYGGRGITMCHSWQTSFEAFLSDMGTAPNGREIDRIDNNGPYCPFNCRWATKTQQANNTRSNRKILFCNETHGMNEWGRILGIPRTTLRARLGRLGWDVQKAFAIRK